MNKGWLRRFWVQQTLIISCLTCCTTHSIFWRDEGELCTNCIESFSNETLLTTLFTAIRLPPFWISYFQRSVNIRATWALTWTAGSGWCVVQIVCFVTHFHSQAGTLLRHQGLRASLLQLDRSKNLIRLPYEKTAELFSDSQSKT